MKAVPASLMNLLAGQTVDPAEYAGTSLSGWAGLATSTEDSIRDVARETVAVEVLDELSPALARAGVRPIVLGAGALWGREYPVPGQRRAFDLDWLIPPADREACAQVLRAAGFTHPASHPMVWRRGPVEIDLHTHAVNDARARAFNALWILDPVALYERGEELPACARAPWRRPDPDDLWVLMAIHALKHEFERLNLVVDLHRLLESHRPASELARRLWTLCDPALAALGLGTPLSGARPPRLAHRLLEERPRRPGLAGLRLLASTGRRPGYFWWHLFWGSSAARREARPWERWWRGWRRFSH